MGNRYAQGKKAIAMCDFCGLQFPLKRLRSLVVKTKSVNMLLCRQCWTKDHPQLQLGMYPVDDPQALRNPRPDNTYWQGGRTGLQVRTDVAPGNVLAFGYPSGGSRVIQWGWNPVGLNDPLGLTGLTNALEVSASVGSVVISIEEP